MDLNALSNEHMLMLSRQIDVWEASLKWYHRLWYRWTDRSYCPWCNGTRKTIIREWNPFSSRGPAIYCEAFCAVCNNTAGTVYTPEFMRFIKSFEQRKGRLRASLALNYLESISDIKVRC
jgi:hypothetical protein